MSDLTPESEAERLQGLVAENVSDLCPIPGGGQMHSYHDNDLTYWRCDCGVVGSESTPAQAAKAHLIHLIGPEAYARLPR
jgi:hypothetical protein